MRSVLVFFGLLSAFMLVSSLPLDPNLLEKRFLGTSSKTLGAASGVLDVFSGPLIVASDAIAAAAAPAAPPPPGR
ncbi:hypothetical protein G6F38_013847 [Rhizopus arrhizus]|nr:hypothetical protein G6F38_013847 [Rhizopus arrhizus]